MFFKPENSASTDFGINKDTKSRALHSAQDNRRLSEENCETNGTNIMKITSGRGDANISK